MEIHDANSSDDRKPKSLKLFAMASALENQQTTKSSLELSFEDRLGILVDAQLAANDCNRLKHVFSKAKLRMSACLEDIDQKTGRGLDKNLARVFSYPQFGWPAAANNHRR